VAFGASVLHPDQSSLYQQVGEFNLSVRSLTKQLTLFEEMPAGELDQIAAAYSELARELEKHRSRFNGMTVNERTHVATMIVNGEEAHAELGRMIAARQRATPVSQHRTPRRTGNAVVGRLPQRPGEKPM
jgi:hypothetical protein